MSLGNPAMHDRIARSVLHMFAVYLSVSFSLFFLDRARYRRSSGDRRPLTTLPLPLSNQASPPFDHPDIAYSILSCLH
jgi:hypothetical protein